DDYQSVTRVHGSGYHACEVGRLATLDIAHHQPACRARALALILRERIAEPLDYLLRCATEILDVRRWPALGVEQQFLIVRPVEARLLLHLLVEPAGKPARDLKAGI